MGTEETVSSAAIVAASEFEVRAPEEHEFGVEVKVTSCWEGAGEGRGKRTP